MNLTRTKPMRRTGIAPVSAARRAEAEEAGVVLFSTFRPRSEWARRDRKPMKASRPKPAVPARTKKTTRQRSEGVCEMQIQGVCTWYTSDASHRDARGMGGRHGEAAAENARPSNVVDACHACHMYCHNNPAWAEEQGFFLESGQDPATTPLMYRGKPSYLDDLGGVWDFEEVGA